MTEFGSLPLAWANAQWAAPSTAFVSTDDGKTFVATCSTCHTYGVTPASWVKSSRAAADRWVEEHWAWHKATPLPKQDGEPGE